MLPAGEASEAIGALHLVEGFAQRGIEDDDAIAGREGGELQFDAGDGAAYLVPVSPSGMAVCCVSGVLHGTMHPARSP
ncbi:MAG TPA: hypothetical protein VK741_23690 [Acetobacteraceae bacterium]|nr:hypothetical protein [Acetobacteraceae bacterium]